MMALDDRRYSQYKALFLQWSAVTLSENEGNYCVWWEPRWKEQIIHETHIILQINLYAHALFILLVYFSSPFRLDV